MAETSDYQHRIARLQALMREQNQQLALLSWTDQMRYLTGYCEDGHKRLLALLVPAQGDPAFVVPSMNMQQARSNSAGITTVLGWEDATGWSEAVQSLLRSWKIADGADVLIDDELQSVHLLGFQELFPTLHCHAADGMLSQLRRIKTDAELASMSTAATLIDTIFEEAVGTLYEGITETELQDVVLAAIKRHSSTPSFSPLVCFGANGAMPHHHSDETKLKRGDVVIIDIGCTSEGYASDITRTLAFGEPNDPDARAVYDLVSRAHHASRAAAKPGVSCAAVDAAARDLIAGEGYGDRFLHRLGHGIGLSTHEPPYMHSGTTLPLEPGMCFSVEPGIYLPDRFGVRIENIVTVTHNGIRSLNAEPATELRIVG